MRLAIQFAPPSDKTPPTFLTGTSGSVVAFTHLAFTVTTDEKCTIAITGGADATQFEFVSTADAFSHVLRWVGNGTRDFGAPVDADANNIYVVQVTATDESGNNQTSQTISITVTASSATPIGLLLVLTR
ncbi:hypothetical protein [Bradyrhizobium elkanii]|jgi:hypothetical protein|uniref:hypothetical protein n=1 Tax=Bradyrhizobium elkanii TaxID=29448 RepID=UPI002169826A|nr:hypothetical protein [Bradyrhizobium elkanii]MCS3690957.1 hypothetical protein [Bradyrhizobium elkanii]